jgi:hypothetical protein
MTLRARLEALEKEFAGGGEVVLTMRDGATRVISLRRDADIMAVFMRTIRQPASEEALAIRQAVEIVEPGGGCMLRLAIAGFLDAPNEPQSIFDEGETL